LWPRHGDSSETKAAHKKGASRNRTETEHKSKDGTSTANHTMTTAKYNTNTALEHHNTIKW